MRTPEEGIRGGAQMDPVEGPAYHEKRFEAAATLAELVGEYVFFTHAALFCHADFDRDPVYDFVAEQAPDCLPFHVDFLRPIFSGLDLPGDPSWNFRLLAVQRRYWPALDWFLLTLSGIDRDRRRFYRVLSQNLPVPD